MTTITEHLRDSVYDTNRHGHCSRLSPLLHMFCSEDDCSVRQNRRPVDALWHPGQKGLLRTAKGGQ